MKKKILAIIAGVIAAWVTMVITEAVNHLIYPPPEGIDYLDIEVIKQLIDGLPFGALLSLVVGWMISAFVGGFVCGKLDKVNWSINSLIIGSVLLAGAIFNMYNIPHPTWMVIVTLIMYVPLTYIGAKTASSK